MMRILAGMTALAATAILPGALGAQTKIKDHVEVEGMGPIEVKGFSVVTGLNGNGDSPGGETETMIRHLMTNTTGRAPDRLTLKNVALVDVTARIRPYQGVGTAFDVRVNAIGDAKSIAGGTLQATVLTGLAPRTIPEGQIYRAVAQGRVVVEGSGRDGNPTSGIVPGGAVIKAEYKTELFKKSTEGRTYFTLVLHRPDFNLAERIATAINELAVTYFDTEKKINQSFPVARAADPGSVDVLIPLQSDYTWVKPPEKPEDVYPGYDRAPVRFLDKVLAIDIPLVSVRVKAVVIINDTTKTVSWNGEVWVRPGRVRVGAIVVGKDTEVLMDLVMKELQNTATPQQVVDIVRAMHAAGMIEAEVRSQ